MAHRFQQPDPVIETDDGLAVLEQIRLLADAVDGLWNPESDLAYRYRTASDWQRTWMRNRLDRNQVERPDFMTASDD